MEEQKKTYAYPGDELALFAGAVRYKRYMAECIKPYIFGNVLEVGGGIGANIPFLLHDAVERWDCLEPDLSLLEKVPSCVGGKAVNKINSTIANVDSAYNVVLYVDVLEHIANDREEMRCAAAHLLANGKRRSKIIIVSPAHQHLYSPFDKKIGHVRRYSKASLSALMPQGFTKKIFFIDSSGYFLSLGNRLLLKQSIPTKKQIDFWDTVIVSLSKISDRLLLNKFGKTIIAIFEKKM